MDEQQQIHPFVADVRWAATAVRRAVDSAMAGEAPLSTCRECGQRFYFLSAAGLVHTETELCPRCEPEMHRTDGLALEQHAIDRAVADRRGLLAAARWVAAERRCALEDAIFFLERVEASEEPLRQHLALARQVVVDPEAAWKAAILVWTMGLAAAAAVDPIAAKMARLTAAQRPDAVVRCVVRARGKVLYNGPVDPEGRCGRAIREGEQRHGRKLLVTLHLVDGRKVHRRGERDTAPEHRFDDAALGGVRAMLAGSAKRASAARGGAVNERPLTVADIKAMTEALAHEPPRCDGFHDVAVPLCDGETVQYVCRRCGKPLAVGVHQANAELLR